MLLTRLHFTLPTLIARFTIVAVATLLFATAAQAAPLSEERVRAFVDSIEAAQALADQHPELFEEEAEGSEAFDASHMFSNALKELDKYPDVREQMVDIVQDHGFEDLDDWGRTGDRIYAAVMALGLEEDSSYSAREMEQAMAELENSGMSEAQKDHARQMMSGAISAFKAAESVPEADKEAVRPYLDELGGTDDDEWE